MSVGTSDTTVISSTKTDTHNLNTIIASAASRDDSSPATFPTTTPKNRHFYELSYNPYISNLYLYTVGPKTRSLFWRFVPLVYLAFFFYFLICVAKRHIDKINRIGEILKHRLTFTVY